MDVASEMRTQLPEGSYRLMPPEEYVSVFRQMRAVFFESSGNRPPAAAVSHHSLTQFPVIKDVFRASAPSQGLVYALWPYSRVGAELPFDLLANNVDDLWLPSSDDLWTSDIAMTWLVELDHEEQLRVFIGPST